VFIPLRRSVVVIALAAATALLFAGCGHKGTASVTNHNAADIAFATNMIPHHRQAVAMADLAPSRASSAKIKALALQIKAAQDPEIALMSGWLKTWSRPVPSGTMTHEGQGTPGMMGDQAMAKLAASSGPEFNRLFLTMMIEHHQGAIDMAHAEERDGTNVGAQKLAKAIAAAQSAEIDEMKELQQSN
jgi:uncharacterized protein (DUF305 family)